MDKNIDLLEGPIFSALFKLALPLMGISFVQMAYSLVDTIWLGRLSTGAVAAVGSVGLFIWVAQAVTLISKVGLSVGMSQALGRGDNREVKRVITASIQVSIFFWLVIALTYFFGRDVLLGFYGLNAEVHGLARGYLAIMAIGMFFTFANPVLSTLFVSRGNSVTPFKISIIALVFNMIMDPLLIFGVGIFPALGVRGAAIATVMAQIVATGLYIYTIHQQKTGDLNVNLTKFSKHHILDVLKLGIPPCLQSAIHASVALILNRYVASFGSNYIAVYSVGAQIESLSWMTAEGFSMAMSTFIGQNYGSIRYERLQEGFKTGMRIIVTIGILVSLLLYFGNESLFAIFVPKDPDTIVHGGQYLKIISISQTFMTIEILTGGAMNGLGLTRYPAIVSTIFNILRIPGALLLMTSIGINGIWWSMSLSSVVKGIVLYLVLYVINRKTNGYRINMNRYVSRQEEI